jgi:hypothetical protein
MTADGELPLLQQFVAGRPFAVAAVVAGGRVVAEVARETFTYAPVRGGNSVWLSTVGREAPGVTAAFDLLQSVGYEGTGDVQYIVEDDGTPRLMEIGVRINAWVDVAVAAGVDVPVIGALTAIGDPPPDVASWRPGVERRAPASELARLREALFSPAGLPPGVSRGDVVRSLWPLWRPGMHYKNIHADDPGPMLPGWLSRRG